MGERQTNRAGDAVMARPRWESDCDSVLTFGTRLSLPATLLTTQDHARERTHRSGSVASMCSG